MNHLPIDLLAAVLGAALCWVILRFKARADAKHAANVIDAARKEADGILRDAQAAAQDKLLKARDEGDREARERRRELAETEKRVMQRETNLDRKVDLLDRKTEEVTKKEQSVVEREKELHKLQGELDELKRLSQIELQRVASLTSDQAKAMLLAQLQDEVRADAGALTRRILDDAKQNADREARRLISIAVERCAADHIQTATSCTPTLPNAETKGRIIGREGRNIRAVEAATGINVLIDDTPQAVVLSGFDPVRRELARITLERLVVDGRINPARIGAGGAQGQGGMKEKTR